MATACERSESRGKVIDIASKNKKSSIHEIDQDRAARFCGACFTLLIPVCNFYFFTGRISISPAIIEGLRGCPAFVAREQSRYFYSPFLNSLQRVGAHRCDWEAVVDGSPIDSLPSINCAGYRSNSTKANLHLGFNRNHGIPGIGLPTGQEMFGYYNLIEK